FSRSANMRRSISIVTGDGGWLKVLDGDEGSATATRGTCSAPDPRLGHPSRAEPRDGSAGRRPPRPVLDPQTRSSHSQSCVTVMTVSAYRRGVRALVDVVGPSPSAVGQDFREPFRCEFVLAEEAAGGAGVDAVSVVGALPTGDQHDPRRVDSRRELVGCLE